jgi:hypothetical protein
MSQLILALDAAGSPNRWIELEDAIHYHVKGLVAWEIGETRFELRGGTNRRTGLRSTVATTSIIAVSGHDFMVRNFDQVPSLTREQLFIRDRHTCAYCGDVLPSSRLEMEHVTPRSRGGAYSWTNLVAACRHCNARKDSRTPEEAGMPLLYVPYVPNRHESLILSNRRVLADQHAWLLQGVPKHSRLHAVSSLN